MFLSHRNVELESSGQRVKFWIRLMGFTNQHFFMPIVFCFFLHFIFLIFKQVIIVDSASFSALI